MARVGRLPSPTGDPRADAAAELRWARGGAGLTLDKLAHMTATLGLPRLRDAVAGLPDSQCLVTAHRTIADATRTLGGSLHARILRAALGFDDDGQARNLTARRARFESVGEPRTLYDIENQMIEALVAALGGTTATATEPVPPARPATGPWAWNVPLLRDPFFVGRDHLVEQIENALRGGGATALTHTVTQTISGLGGIGKTSVAAEYAYRHAARYDVVWWMRAEDPTTLASDVAALARALEPSVRRSNQTEETAAATAWLATHDRWLLVFDNATDPDEIAPYLPGLRGHVLVTSRNPHWSTIATVLDVPPLDLDSAADLICQRTGADDRAAARTLAAKLAGIPKVIDLAAAMFTRGSATSLARFAERLGDGAAATAGVWDAAFDRALGLPGSAEILATCSVLNPDDIPLELLAAASALPEDAVETSVGALRAQQILRLAVDGLTMHRLVQSAARHRLGDDECRDAATRVGEVLLRIDPLPQPVELPYARRVQIHTPYVTAALGDDAGPLLEWYATRLFRDGAYDAARATAERALAVTEATRGAEHPDVARCLIVLARILPELGDLPAARVAAERAVAIAEATLGPDHPTVAGHLRVLTIMLGDLGNLRAAHNAAERALAVAETHAGPDDPSLGEHLHRVAWTRCEVGDLRGAREAAERALAVTEAALGPRHSTVGVRLGQLAWILGESGELDTARDLARRALATSEAALGPHHPEVGINLDLLAWILGALGETEEARALAERALAVTTACRVPGHPEYGRRLFILARILGYAGELDAARDTAERGLAISEAALGLDHPDVARQLRDYAVVLGRLGEHAAARAAAERALAITVPALGPDHPETGRELGVLAHVLRDCGDLDAAGETAGRALAVAEAALGAGNPDVRVIRGLLAALPENVR